MSSSHDKAEESSSAYDDYAWDVETSVPADSLVEDEEYASQEASDKTIVFILASMLASFALPAIFGSIFLIAPLLIAIAGLIWGFRARRKGIRTKVLQPVIWTTIAMMVAGYLAMELVPDTSWESIFPVLFQVGIAIFGVAIVGIVIILVRDRTKK